MAEEQKRLNTFIHAPTFRDMKIVAAEKGWTLSETASMLLRLGIEDYVKDKHDGDE